MPDTCAVFGACDWAYFSYQPPGRWGQTSCPLFVLSLWNFITTKESHITHITLCVILVMDSQPQWGPWSRSSFFSSLTDSLLHSWQCSVTVLSTFLRSLTSYSKLTLSLLPEWREVIQREFSLLLVSPFSVFLLTSPSFSSRFQISQKEAPFFLSLTPPLVVLVIFPSHILLALPPSCPSSFVHSLGTFIVYSFHTYIQNACRFPRHWDGMFSGW